MCFPVAVLPEPASTRSSRVTRSVVSRPASDHSSLDSSAPRYTRYARTRGGRSLGGAQAFTAKAQASPQRRRPFTAKAQRQREGPQRRHVYAFLLLFFLCLENIRSGRVTRSVVSRPASDHPSLDSSAPRYTRYARTGANGVWVARRLSPQRHRLHRKGAGLSPQRREGNTKGRKGDMFMLSCCCSSYA